MKARIAGLILLVVVILAAGGYYLYSSGKPQITTLDGYLGGEKIGLFEDEEVKEVLRKNYGLELEYAKAGSLDMVTADQEGMDYLFPSSRTALDYYRDVRGEPAKQDIILNTPIVIYTHQMVLDALLEQKVATERDGSFYVDMQKLTDLMLADTSWADIGLPELYGSVSVDTTDPVKSNSGNVYAGLLANVLNGGETVDETSVGAVLLQLKKIFSRLGYMETSSADLFDQFLKTGVGAKPMIAGYESQLLEFSVQNPEEYETLKEDIVMLYPTPTIWSTHVLIALDDPGEQLISALLDEKVQALAWEKHGFRTSLYSAASDVEIFPVEETCQEITQVMEIPDYQTMKQIIDYLS